MASDEDNGNILNGGGLMGCLIKFAMPFIVVGVVLAVLGTFFNSITIGFTHDPSFIRNVKTLSTVLNNSEVSPYKTLSDDEKIAYIIAFLYFDDFEVDSKLFSTDVSYYKPLKPKLLEKSKNSYQRGKSAKLSHNSKEEALYEKFTKYMTNIAEKNMNAILSNEVSVQMRFSILLSLTQCGYSHYGINNRTDFKNLSYLDIDNNIALSEILINEDFSSGILMSDSTIQDNQLIAATLVAPDGGSSYWNSFINYLSPSLCYTISQKYTPAFEESLFSYPEMAVKLDKDFADAIQREIDSIAREEQKKIDSGQAY